MPMDGAFFLDFREYLDLQVGIGLPSPTDPLSVDLELAVRMFNEIANGSITLISFSSTQVIATVTLLGDVAPTYEVTITGQGLSLSNPVGTLETITMADMSGTTLATIQAPGATPANPDSWVFTSGSTDPVVVEFLIGIPASVEEIIQLGEALSAFVDPVLWAGLSAAQQASYMAVLEAGELSGFSISQGGVSAMELTLANDQMTLTFGDYILSFEMADAPYSNYLEFVQFAMTMNSADPAAIQAAAVQIGVTSASLSRISDGAVIMSLEMSPGSVLDSNTGNNVSFEFLGTDFDDILFGGDYGDFLSGRDGGDELYGGGGNDILNGENINLTYDSVYSQVFRLYQATLDRAPDRAGHMDWSQQILSGTSTLLEVVTGFVNSAEFQAAYGATDNDAFVTLLYQNVLNRGPDAAGLAYWTGLLDAGTYTREQVVLGFSESQEFINDTAGAALAHNWAGIQSDWVDNVFRLYQATLNQTPDLSGLTFWAGQLASGGTFLSVIADFVSSPVFEAVYGGTNNNQFVTLLYQNVLNRAADAGGLAYWTDLLDTGTYTREQVVLGFSESQEFINASLDGLVAYIRALGDHDRLVGGAGDNTLFGGWGADTFVFNANEVANDTVVGFDAWDWIELQQSTFANAAEAMAALSQTGEGVTLTDGATTILFDDARLTDFSQDSFLFV